VRITIIKQSIAASPYFSFVGPDSLRRPRASISEGKVVDCIDLKKRKPNYCNSATKGHLEIAAH